METWLYLCNNIAISIDAHINTEIIISLILSLSIFIHASYASVIIKKQNKNSIINL